MHRPGGSRGRTLGVWVAVCAVAIGCGPDRHEVAAPSADGAPDDGSIGVDAAIDAAVDVAIDAAAARRRPRVIVMIGDGMGQAQLDAASLYAAGATGALFMQGLPARGELRTGGPTGTTDSAAAATVMATGVYTYNGSIGVDRDGAAVETLVELARARGLGSGLVTTASLPHATPAGFSAHASSRGMYTDIAAMQVRVTQPDVMLGGGAQYYRPAGAGSVRTDGGLLVDLAAAGYQQVFDRAALAAAEPDAAGPDRAARLFGAFAADHLTYVRDRGPASSEPTLGEMSLRALDFLDRDRDGFFLMIEGGRIDHAGHANDLANDIGETLAFDDAIRAVAAWAASRDDVTLLVTADHECGGLEVVRGAGAGSLPDVRWRWGNHTNARVAVFGSGPGSDVFDQAVRDHRWIHAVARARLTGEPLRAPAPVLIPDGDLHDLTHVLATQTLTTSFGAGVNQLEGLRIDADDRGLVIGLEGVFEWDRNAIVLLLDVDPGAGTGPATMRGAVHDTSHPADAILSSLQLTAPAMPGFGVDLAVVIPGGADPKLDQLGGDAGLRGLRPPYGALDDVGWLPAAVNFEAVRTRGSAIAPLAGAGVEIAIPWRVAYPGGRPEGWQVAVAAVIVNSDGGYTSNQALPPFPAGTASPGRAAIALPVPALFPAQAP